MNVLDLYRSLGLNPGPPLGRKREHHCPCPACSGGKSDSDRFRIFPDDNSGYGRYSCRPEGNGCGLHGDNVQFCQDFLGMEFKEATEHCGRHDLLKDHDQGSGSVSRKSRKSSRLSLPEEQKQPVFEPQPYTVPPEKWRSKAAELVYRCRDAIQGQKKVLDWLASRGISNELITRYALGWNIGDKGMDLHKYRPAWGLPQEKDGNGRNRSLWIPRGLVIPTIIAGEVVGLQVRRRPDDRKKFAEQIKYAYVSGGYNGPFVLYPERRAFVVVEARLDAIACAESQGKAGAMALGSISAYPDRYTDRLLRNCLKILDALDFGDKKGKTAAGRAAQWWPAQYPGIYERWPVPKGKDPGEAAQHGVDLGAWIMAGLPPVFMVESAGECFSPVLLKEAAEIPTEEKVRQPAGDLDGKPAQVTELLALLKGNPVSIVNSRDEMTIKADPIWILEHVDIFGAISELIYGPLLDFISRHPCERITAKNLMQKAA